MDELFKKSVPVKLKSNDRDERQVSVGVTVILKTLSTPVHKKELVIRLTDERDPFFLFTMALSEEDFQSLKVQQGLLVDFGSFPRKLIDLLELCLLEISKESPKFLLQFCESEGHNTPSLLHVVETNPFRHLNHLSLKFLPASDVYLKKYLAECLLRLKEENAVLSSQLNCTKSDLSARLTEYEEALRSRTQELESLKSDWSSHTALLTTQHSSSLNVEREKALQTQTQAQTCFEQEKKDLVQAHLERLKSMEGRLQELDHGNKELTDGKFRSESTIRELEAQLKSNEAENLRMKEDLLKLRSESSTLYTSTHEQEKMLTQLQTRVAVLEQELKDKQQVIGQNTQLLAATQEQNKTYESALVQKERQITKLDTAFKSASQEVLKGNEIIQKLQAEIRNVKSKLKVRNVVTTKQENLLGEKDKAIDTLQQEMETLNRTLTHKDEELEKSEAKAEEVKGKLEEAQDQLRTNENVISWLNKQVTDQKLGVGGRVPPGVGVAGGRVPPGVGVGRGLPPGTGLRSSPASLFPPYTVGGVAVNNAYTGLANSQGMPLFSSTPANAVTSYSSSSLPQYHTSSAASSLPAQQRNVLGSLGSQENIGRQQQQVLFKGGGGGGTKKLAPSPLSAHTQVASPPGAPPSANEKQSAAANKVSPKAGEPWLDPKYLPPEPPSGADRVSPYSITPGVVKAPGGSGGAVPGKLRPAALASSYFPKS